MQDDLDYVNRQILFKVVRRPLVIPFERKLKKKERRAVKKFHRVIFRVIESETDTSLLNVIFEAIAASRNVILRAL